MASSLITTTNTGTSRVAAWSTFSCNATYLQSSAFLVQRHATWTRTDALPHTVTKIIKRMDRASTQQQTSSSPPGVLPCGVPRAGPGSTPEKEKSSAFPAEDQRYLGKLFAGCAAGAGVIKYGSVLFPQITQPSLVVASIAVTAPIVASVVLLWAASSNSGPPSSDI